MTVNLSVNLNAVALLRNRRDLPWPSVTGLGRIALEAGARGLTVHPRPDERHIRRTDVFELVSMLRGEYAGREFNIEGFPDERWLTIVEQARPDQATLVPDDPAQATSDHGWDFEKSAEFLTPRIARLKALGIRVSLFADPTPDGLEAARRMGADRVELYTGPYGACHDDPARARAELERLSRAGRRARELGLGLNAGHDLTVENLPPLIAELPFIGEVSIGHGLTADALIHGMAETVRRFRRALGDPAA